MTDADPGDRSHWNSRAESGGSAARRRPPHCAERSACIWWPRGASRPASHRERVALALCEAITLLTEGHVPDDVWDAAAAEFDQEELMCLVWQCVAINSWNRVCVATRAVAGQYRSRYESVTQR